MSYEYEDVDEMMDEWETNVTAIARALGLERKLEGDTATEEVASFKAALSGRGEEAVEKAAAEADDHDLDDAVERIRRALHLVAREVDAPERELKGEYDPDTENTKAFKSALSGETHGSTTEDTDAGEFKEAMGGTR